MQANRFYFIMLLFLVCTLGYFTYRIMSPFSAAIAWAVVATIIFYPVYAFFSRYVKVESLASILTVAVILVVILGPFAYLTSMLINELRMVAASIDQNKLDSLQQFVEKVRSYSLFARISSYVGFDALTSEEAIRENAARIGKGLIQNLSMGIPNILSVVVNFIFMIFTTFFLLKDGPGLLAKMKAYMPFSERQKGRLATQIKDMIVSTVYGGVLVSITQGTLGGFAFYFLGLDSPVLWGLVMAVTSFVPLLGTFAVWGPASAYLLIQGAYMKAAGLMFFGVFVISMVDNILKPLIIGSRTKLPTILILFSVLGGIKLFGVIGLITGPLVTAVFISVIEIFSNIEGGSGVES